MNFLQKEWERFIVKTRRQILERQTIGKNLDFKNPWILMATWFGSGVFLPASGVWGTLATLPFAIPIWFFAGKMGLVAFLILVFILGMKASAEFERQTNTHDSGLIVIDEVIGFTIVLLSIPFDAYWISTAFVAFRVFDTVKPWPISWVDKNTQGAWGVIADDIVAGIATALLLIGLQYGQIFS